MLFSCICEFCWVPDFSWSLFRTSFHWTWDWSFFTTSWHLCLENLNSTPQIITTLCHLLSFNTYPISYLSTSPIEQWVEYDVYLKIHRGSGSIPILLSSGLSLMPRSSLVFYFRQNKKLTTKKVKHKTK